jgi:hypothetical protein
MVSIAKVYSIREVKIGFTLSTDGAPPAMTVDATGMVNSGGWSQPELGVWMYIVPPADGILSMDFMATPPSPGTIVTMGFTEVHAQLLMPVPSWVKGVRVHGATNSVEQMLDGTLPMIGGDFVPWPWPWWKPDLPAAE